MSHGYCSLQTAIFTPSVSLTPRATGSVAGKLSGSETPVQVWGDVTRGCLRLANTPTVTCARRQTTQVERELTPVCLRIWDDGAVTGDA